MAKKLYLYKIFPPQMNLPQINGPAGDTIDIAAATALDKSNSRSFPQLLIGYPQTFQHPMKIKPDQLDSLASLLLANYQSKQLISTKASEATIKSKIIDVIAKNFAEEEAIEEEARKMLASHARVTRDMDPYKMFLLAKQKLAAKKGFIL